LFAGAPEARSSDTRVADPHLPDGLSADTASAATSPDPRALDLRLADARPFVSASPTPRPPLAVRRATVEIPRARAGAASASTVVDSAVAGASLHAPVSAESPAPIEEDALALPTDAPPDPEPAPATPAPETSEGDAAVVPDATPSSSRTAPISARVTAGLIDAAILGAIDLTVVGFTLQLTGVPWTQIGRLPLAPLLAFLALLATGYLSMFTVLAGQTAGKMVAHIRVVETGGRPVRFGHAVLRSAVQVLTVPLLGLGFLPALLASDHRALYDRLSDTEVIRSDG
jgi:uncharacterized RDD family membrane protein YckC